MLRNKSYAFKFSNVKISIYKIKKVSFNPFYPFERDK